MAELSGKTGAIYYRKATITGTGIAFVDSNPDTITDTGNGFVTAGFENADKVTVSGSANNDGTYTADSVAAGTLTLAAGDTLTAEGAGATVTIVEALPGSELAGFFNWTIDDGVDALDTTDFGSSGNREFIAGQRGWSGSAEKHWLTEGNQESWIGTEVLVRFFVRYDATPATTTAYYYESTGLVTGVNTNTPADTLVNQTLTFEGVGALGSLTSRTTAWP